MQTDEHYSPKSFFARRALLPTNTERRALRAKVKALKHVARRQNGVTAIKSFRETFGSSEDEVGSMLCAFVMQLSRVCWH